VRLRGRDSPEPGRPYPEPDGEVVITRYRVIELLRKLDGPASEGSGQPDGLVAGIGREVQLASADIGIWPTLSRP
jgi:hypothetical protein